MGPLGLLRHLGLRKSASNVESVCGGRYRILRKLGAGNWATVYEVEAQDGRLFAMKRSDVAHMGEADRRAAVNELRLLASLHHFNLVQFNEAFVEGDFLYSIMDLCLGGSLDSAIRAHLEHRQFISEAQVWAYLLQAARALHHLHSHNVVHRDIKPANLLLCEGGLLKVADLGVARVLSQAPRSSQQPVGTVGFMAPEVFSGQQGSQPAADMFAVGVCLYELCVLRSPVRGGTEDAVAAALARWGAADAAAAAAALYPRYSPELRGLVEALLQPSPAARPSAAQVLERHGTPARLAALPAPLPEDACGRAWDDPASQDSPILPPIDAADLAGLSQRLPAPCCGRMTCGGAPSPPQPALPGTPPPPARR